ncbi:Crp/Fnr family transcriptional regulator [Oscillatoriales cyanobacterium LEGE 11467]|uniref:Crp/Fnr family transcriptional regulator n=1 Tax=Zarconia navalis LEGE 11467 TaxID=1828826 RepID=A0A928W096_9CYAN|nr:Crp/Fnr family transcriptional regulator [Zarconia navalis]MBE9042122.1 Crp/Fnr family transcriptional regulator [Zarconia navalis LEGE 11467]
MKFDRKDSTPPVSERILQPINQILAAIPDSEYQRLSPYLKPVTLTSGQVLTEPGEPVETVYFPERAMISLVSIMSDGSTTEIGLVGNEGMVGLSVVLGGGHTTSRSIVQIAGSAMQLRADVLRQEFDRAEKLQKLLLLYTQALLTQVSQSAACNRQHTTEERLARWLLSVHDCIQKDELPLTQEFIANMLGIRRSGVTVAAGILQQAGIIRYHRGHITILNQEDLEATACECYRLVQSEFIRLLGSRRG